MENILENKAKFFSQYWGQTVIEDVNNAGDKVIYPVVVSNMNRFEESILVLKPLSSITDEDAMFINDLEIWNYEINDVGKVKNILMNCIYYNRGATKTHVYDYLRSKGYALPYMGLSVETLVEYLPPSGASKLFAISGTSIFDATTAGAVGTAVVTGLSNAIWNEASITTPGGSFLYLVNGVDAPRLWDGTTWTTITGVSTPAITCVTTTLWAEACLFNTRLFFVENNSLSVWYLPVNSIGGAAAELDLGSVRTLQDSTRGNALIVSI